MKKMLLLAALVLMSAPSWSQRTYISPEIKPYLDFINKTDTSPVDYIMGLFEKYDVVILGERDHRDTTQYDLIEAIISDPRFIENVGHVMTEIGSNNQTARANALVTGDYPDFESFYEAAIPLLRDLTFIGIWEKSNFHQYLRSIWEVNRNLPAEKKVTVTFTDMQWSWEQSKRLDTDDFMKFAKTADDFREIIMAENAITSLNRIFDGDSPRKKALIIYNRPHSYQQYWKPKSALNLWSAGFIFDRFPGRVANVMINWFEFSKEKPGDRLAQEGKWDAAFQASGNKYIGFDFAESPFGDDMFDFYSNKDENIKFKDAYTGFIFYKPILEWVTASGHPGFIDDEFWPEFVRRMKLMPNFRDATEEQLSRFKVIANQIDAGPIFNAEEMEAVRKQIESWLTAP